MAAFHSLGEVKDEIEGISDKMMCVKSSCWSGFFFLVELDESWAKLLSVGTNALTYPLPKVFLKTIFLIPKVGYGLVRSKLGVARSIRRVAPDVFHHFKNDTVATCEA